MHMNHIKMQLGLGDWFFSESLQVLKNNGKKRRYNNHQNYQAEIILYQRYISKKVPGAKEQHYP